jgi:hypothetical protein
LEPDILVTQFRGTKHRFDVDDHSLLQTVVRLTLTEEGEMGFLVEMPSQTMSGESR